MDPVSLIAFGGWLISLLWQCLVITVLCWLVAALLVEVSKYLKNKCREFGVLFRRQALDDIIAAANRQDVKAELQKIRDRHDGLFIPLNADQSYDYDNLCLVSAKDNMKSDFSDCEMFGDDEYSHGELERIKE